jgi:hypothetical protein
MYAKGGFTFSLKKKVMLGQTGPAREDILGC